MTDIFRTILNMSITGAYIAAAIILLRFIMKKLPRKYSYRLWCILGIRLLCPISISSAVSFFNLFKPSVVENEMTYIPQDVVYAEAPAVNVGVPVVNNYVNEVLPAATAEASVNPMQLVMGIAAVVWLVGIATMLVYSVVSYAAVRKRVASATVVQDNVYLCGGIETPFVYGIIKPKIYIPSSVSGADLEYILAHERVHISRGDHIVKLIALAALTLHWFNPLAWISFRLMVNDMELSCDEKALTGFDRDVKKDYASALLNISMKQNNLSYGGLLSFGESNIKARIKGVLSAKKPALIVSVVAVTALIIAAVCLLTNASKNDDFFTETVNKEYASYLLEDPNYAIGTQYRERTPEQMSKFMQKLKKTKAKLMKKEFVTEENMLNTDYDRSNTTYRTVNLFVLDNCDGECVSVIIAHVSRGEDDDVFYLALCDNNFICSYEVSDDDWHELAALYNDSFDNIIYSIANNSERELIILERGGTEREFAYDEVAPFIYKLNNIQSEKIDGSKLTFADGGYNYTVSLYPKADNRANYSSFDIISALDENGEQIYCISILSTNTYNVYKISEEDFNELTRLFDLGFDRNYDGFQTTIPDETTIPEPVSYDDEYKLCEDYLTNYLYRDEEAFYPSRYINDTDMLVYVNTKLAYEKINGIESTILDVTVHSDSAERIVADDGTVILKVPYEASFRYSGSTSDSGYGRKAYFEVKNTDSGWKIYRVYDSGPTDYQAFGYDHKDIDSLDRLTLDLAEGTSSLGGNTTYQQFSVVFPDVDITMEKLQAYGTGSKADAVEPFTADFILPSGWTVRYPAENEANQAPSGNWAKNIYDKDGKLIGSVSFDVFDHMDGVPDEEYYKVAYSGIRLGSIVSLGDITAVSKTGAGENAVSVVMVNQMDGDSAAASTIKKYPVALSYNKLLGVYVRIDFYEGAVTDEQLNAIAKSIWIKAKSPDITVTVRENAYPLGVEEITIDITNNSSEAFKYYKDVEVAYYDAGEWKACSENTSNTNGKYVNIEAGKTYSDKVSMKPYNVSEEGKYKISVKDDGGDNYYSTQVFELVKEEIIGNNTADASEISIVPRKNEYPIGIVNILFDVNNNTSLSLNYNKYDYKLQYNNGGKWDDCTANAVNYGDFYNDGKVSALSKSKHTDEVRINGKFSAENEGEYRLALPSASGQTIYSEPFKMVKMFDVNIYTEKQTYTTDEDIKVYATYSYVGKEKQLDVVSSFSCVSFQLEGTKLFNDGQGGAVVPDIAQLHTLKKGEKIRADFSKSGGWANDDENAEFYKDFYSTQDLKYPADDYTITAVFNCFTDEDDASSSTVIITKTIKIKVE